MWAVGAVCSVPLLRSVLSDWTVVKAEDNWRADERRRLAETQIKGDRATKRLRQSGEGVETEREAPQCEASERQCGGERGGQLSEGGGAEVSAADRLESLNTTEMGSRPLLPLSAPSSLVRHELLLKTLVLVSRQRNLFLVCSHVTHRCGTSPTARRSPPVFI